MGDRISTSRMNGLTRAVNAKARKEDVEFRSKAEEAFFDDTWKYAEEHEKKYGQWPVFSLGEIDSDDPVTDIYSEDAEEWAKDRKSRRGIDEIDEV